MVSRTLIEAVRFLLQQYAIEAGPGMDASRACNLDYQLEADMQLAELQAQARSPIPQDASQEKRIISILDLIPAADRE